MTYRRVAALLAVVAVAGCAAAADAPDEPRPEPSRLVIHEKRAAGGVMYIEGAIGFLRVAPAASGTDLEATEVPSAMPGERALIFDERLEPGAYRIASYQRPCDGNCGYLDPPTDRCATTLQLAAGQTRELTIVVQPGRSCRITS